MIRKINQFMLLLMMVSVVMSSAIGATIVYADDGSGTGDPSQPTGEVIPPVDEVTPPEPSGEVVAPADGELPAAPVEGEQPVAPVEGELPAEEQSVVEEPVSVPEVLAQLPENIELVVINDAGQIEPLATEAAAEIIASGDPMWCPEGATPGDAGCSGSFTKFSDLITALKGGVFSGNGVIWVEGSYNGNDDSQVVFDGDVLTSLKNSNLEIKGGWSGNNDTSINGTSMADVSFVFANWTGNITLNDLDIVANDGAGFGLFMNNTGAVTLNNVSVNGTTANAFGLGDGAVLKNTGNVIINNSEFDNNKGNGLKVETTGTIRLDTVSASGNSLTGANLDDCLYNSATGLCAGSGVVTITSATGNLFNDNGFNGLAVDSGGGIEIDHTQANTNGLNGAYLTSADRDGAGNVIVEQSAFTGNQNGKGLDILTSGNVLLTAVDVFSNRSGAVINTASNGTGSIFISDSSFGDNNSNGNAWTGLHAESGNVITLSNVVASYNGTNGAYLTANGDINVTDSTFSENVHFNFPQDPGLYAKSKGGNITLLNVFADGNDYGAGAVLITESNGAVDVTDAQFNENGLFGVQAQTKDGDISLDGITASFNKVKGAYLTSYGIGNIFVSTGNFVENGSYGIYANTSLGGIDLDQITVTGDNKVDNGAAGADDLTNIGAFLKTTSGGPISVNESAFNLNTETGLVIVTSGQVDLVDVTADQNGGNGVEVYSNYTYGCMCPNESPSSVNVFVDGGTFTNNGKYGLQVLPGTQGSLTFVNPPTTAATVFANNNLGDSLLDKTYIKPNCAACACGECCDPPDNTDPKNPKIVTAPSVDNLPVKQECDLFSSTILKLPGGTWANVGCPFSGYSNLKETPKESLPGLLGAGLNFVSGITVSLTDEEGNAILNEDGTVTINFIIPKDSRGRGYAILFWDPNLNDGAGGWVELPLFEAGTSFPLNPNDPEDARTIISGIKQDGDTVTFTVNFPGVFVLASR